MVIEFNRIVNFHGRNGYFKASGIEIINEGDKATFWPITTRGKAAVCEIQIPKENLKEFIKQLETLL